jgi:hypothetical protein
VRHAWFYRCAGLALILAVVYAVSYPVLDHLFN